MCFVNAPKVEEKAPPPPVIPVTPPERVSEDVLAARQRALAKRGRGFIGANVTKGALADTVGGTTSTGLFSPATGSSATTAGLFG